MNWPMFIAGLVIVPATFTSTRDEEIAHAIFISLFVLIVAALCDKFYYKNGRKRLYYIIGLFVSEAALLAYWYNEPSEALWGLTMLFALMEFLLFAFIGSLLLVFFEFVFKKLKLW